MTTEKRSLPRISALIIGVMAFAGCATTAVLNNGLAAADPAKIEKVDLVFEKPEMSYLAFNKLILRVALKGSTEVLTLPKLYDVKLSSPDNSASFFPEDRVSSTHFHAFTHTTVSANHPNFPQGEIKISAPNRWEQSYLLNYSGESGYKSGESGGDGANLKIEAVEVDAASLPNPSGPVMVLVRVLNQNTGKENSFLFPKDAKIQVWVNGGNGHKGADGMDSMMSGQAYASQPSVMEGHPGGNGGNGGHGGNVEFFYGHKGLDRMFVFQNQGGQGAPGGIGGNNKRKYSDGSGKLYWNIGGGNAPSGMAGVRGQQGQTRTALQEPAQLMSGLDNDPHWKAFVSRIRPRS